MNLRPCSHCRRHVATEATTCPFCAAALAPASPRPLVSGGRLGRAAIFAGATLAACWTGKSTPDPQHVEQTTGGSGDVVSPTGDGHFAQAPTDAGVPSADAPVKVAPPPPPYDTACCKPYGAPPARRRVV